MSSIRRCAQANLAHDADALNAEHGYVKTYLYELENIAQGQPRLAGPRPRFPRDDRGAYADGGGGGLPRLPRRRCRDEQNAKLTALMNKEGFKMA